MIGKLLAGHYKIIQVLGAGGFGKTYIVEDIHLPGNPKCALKHLVPTNSDPSTLDTTRKLFHREAETLQKLGKHDQIPRLFAYFEENEEFYLVQELINGHTLSEELPNGKIWNQTQISEMLIQVLEILIFVHSQGVIHRDIKPDNIIRRSEDNKLVLIDFGAIKQVRNQSVVVGTEASISVSIGTPGYMPTEQTQGKARPNSDIYALGMIGIQALTGLYPQQLQEDVETGEIIWQHLTTANPQLIAILEKMTRYHFKDRYQTAVEAASALSHNPQFQNLGSPPVANTVKAKSLFSSQQKTIPVAPGNPLPSSPSSVPVLGLRKFLSLIGLGIGLVIAGSIAKLFYDYTHSPSVNSDKISTSTLASQAIDAVRSSTESSETEHKQPSESPAAVTNSDAEGLKFCNRTNLTLSLAVGKMVDGQKFSQGWYSLKPTECSPSFFGRLSSDQKYYFYAKGYDASRGKRLEWEEKEEETGFCIAEEGKTVEFKPDSNCEEKRRFKRIDVGSKKAFIRYLNMDE